MSNWREEHFYFGFLILLGLMEFALAIPLTIPLFDGVLAQLYLVVALMHVAGILFLLTKMVDMRPYSLHIIGMLGFFFSVIPYINSLFHLAVVVIIVKTCMKYMRYFKELRG